METTPQRPGMSGCWRSSLRQGVPRGSPSIKPDPVAASCCHARLRLPDADAEDGNWAKAAGILPCGDGDQSAPVALRGGCQRYAPQTSGPPTPDSWRSLRRAARPLHRRACAANRDANRAITAKTHPFLLRICSASNSIKYAIGWRKSGSRCADRR